MTNSIVQLIDAVEVGEQSFSTLRHVETVKSADGSLFCIAGGESVLFQVFIDGTLFALKCYTADVYNRKLRYDDLKKLSEAYGIVPSMTYLENELKVIDDYGVQKYVDVLVYPWVEGVSLMEAIEDAVGFYDTAALMKLCRNFTLLAQELLSLPFSHGDIKPQNIIVGIDGKMSLIDFDTSFSENIPADHVVCSQWYQHPSAEAWDEDYAVAVIVVSVFLLSLDPQLFYKYHNGENIILDARKLVKSGSVYKELRAMLVPYPGYMQLFEFISSPDAIKRSIAPVLSEICGALPSDCRIIDDCGVLRRVVNENGLYGFIDGEGQIVLGCCYGDATPFNDGVAGVRLNGAWYIFNDSGHCVADAVFDEVGVSANGVMPVSRNGKWYYLNSYTFERTCCDEYDYAYPFGGKFGLVRVGDDFYFIDDKGGKLFGARSFVFARPFVNGYAVVADCEGYFVIDEYGRNISGVSRNRILDCDGKYIYYRNNGLVVKSEI